MKIWKNKFLTVALGLSLLAPTGAFAASAVTGGENTIIPKGITQHRFGGEQSLLNKDQLLDLAGKYEPDSLQEWEDALAEQEQLLNQLKDGHMQQAGISDEIKEKIKAIHETVQNGDISQEEAREQLKGLGLNKNFPDGPKLKLSDEAKEKMNAIHEAVQNGDISPEKIREQLQEFGIDKNFADRQKLELSDETREKINALREAVHNGDISSEEAREQLKEFGVDRVLVRGPLSELNEAVQANDELKIKEMLGQLLEQLKERNQQLSARLS